MTPAELIADLTAATPNPGTIAFKVNEAANTSYPAAFTALTQALQPQFPGCNVLISYDTDIQPTIVSMTSALGRIDSITTKIYGYDYVVRIFSKGVFLIPQTFGDGESDTNKYIRYQQPYVKELFGERIALNTYRLCVWADTGDMKLPKLTRGPAVSSFDISGGKYDAMLRNKFDIQVVLDIMRNDLSLLIPDAHVWIGYTAPPKSWTEIRLFDDDFENKGDLVTRGHFELYANTGTSHTWGYDWAIFPSAMVLYAEAIDADNVKGYISCTKPSAMHSSPARSSGYTDRISRMLKQNTGRVFVFEAKAGSSYDASSKQLTPISQ